MEVSQQRVARWALRCAPHHTLTTGWLPTRTPTNPTYFPSTMSGCTWHQARAPSRHLADSMRLSLKPSDSRVLATHLNRMPTANQDCQTISSQRDDLARTASTRLHVITRNPASSSHQISKAKRWRLFATTTGRSYRRNGLPMASQSRAAASLAR